MLMSGISKEKNPLTNLIHRYLLRLRVYIYILTHCYEVNPLCNVTISIYSPCVLFKVKKQITLLLTNYDYKFLIKFNAFYKPPH